MVFLGQFSLQSIQQPQPSIPKPPLSHPIIIRQGHQIPLPTHTKKTMPQTTIDSTTLNHPPQILNLLSKTHGLSAIEIEDIRKKWLCFGYEARYVEGYKCRQAQLYQMLLDDLRSENGSEEFKDCLDNPEDLG